MIGLTAAFDRSRHVAPHVQNRIEADKRRQRQFIQKQDERQKREEQLERAEEDFSALAGAVTTAMASSERIEAFEAELTTYDTAVVEALMENDQQMAVVQERLDALLERAYVMEDGRRVFRTEDGTQVFDEFGVEVPSSELDPALIPEHAPTWEQARPDVEAKNALLEERAQLLDYQRQLDEAREAVADGEISEADLTELETNLRETMPDAVRAQLPKGHPAARVEQAAEQTATVQTPSLDGLQGFSMPSLGG